MKKIKKLVSALCAAAVVMGLSACNSNAPYPNKEITMVVPFGSGCSTDLLARTLAEPAGQALGESVIVTNVSGASGTVGSAQVASSDPDGYNVMFVTSAPLTIQPYFMGGLTYTTENFTPICNVASEPSCIAVAADSPYQTLEDLMNSEKEISAGNTGVGTLHYLLQIEAFEQAGAEYKQVAFEGGAKLVTGLLGGNVDCISTVTSEINDYVDSGDMRILAISSAERSELYPDIPTFAELGYDLDMSLDYFVVAPADLPEDVFTALESAFETAAMSDTVTEFLANSNVQPNYMDSETLAAKLASDSEQYQEIVASIQ